MNNFKNKTLGLQADLALRAKDYAQVKTLLQAHVPEGAEGRPEQLFLAQAETASGQAQQAAERLQRWVSLHADDGTAWQLLAAAWRERGQPLHALRAEGQAQLAWQDLAGAVQRFRAAQDWVRQHPQADHIEAAIVDTRLRETQQALKAQQEEEKE